MRSAQAATARRLLGGTFLVYALLVATHLGEFWPFSIYPMFSQGGNTWTRAIVRDVSEPPEGTLWQTVYEDDDLPGEAYPLGLTDINQNDVANFVSKTRVWNADRIAALRKIFGESLDERSLLVFRVQGRLAEGRDVEVAYTPFLVLAPDSTYFNPTLDIVTE